MAEGGKRGRGEQGIKASSHHFWVTENSKLHSIFPAKPFGKLFGIYLLSLTEDSSWLVDKSTQHFSKLNPLTLPFVIVPLLKVELL